jgi:soluble lytic murein transglycosylase-like protein
MGLYMKLALIWWAIVAALIIASIRAGATELIIERVAPQYGIEPSLVRAIIFVESSNNPNAVGRDGEVGLMQLHPKWHPNVSFDPKENIKLGIKYLAKIRARHGARHTNSWFVFFNYGPNKKLDNPRETEYYKKVIRSQFGNVATN